MSTAWLVVGPADHGVPILAEQLLRQQPARPRDDVAVVVRADDDPVVVRADDVRGLGAELAGRWPGVDAAHVHFTDQLFGPDCARAGAAYVALAHRLAEREVRLGVTLHDLPLDPDDPARYRRRADAYAAVVAATTGPVIVSSHHEAALLARFAPDVRPTVIALPIEPGTGAAPAVERFQAPSDVAVLGYLYPGKGHLAALEALTALPRAVGLTVLGRVADGHDELADRLRTRAQRLGRRFTVTGWVPDADLRARLRAAVIPFVGHERLSASGSIGSWLSAGRRPLVPDGAYVRELSERCPGSVTVYPASPAGLRAALARAFAEPGSTWLTADVKLGPSPQDAARAYAEVMASAPAP